MRCSCGKEFKPKSTKNGRGKYCSKECMYTYRVRPSGLKYNITSENSGWFKPGINSYPEFKPRGKIPKNFKGEQASYSSYHKWLYRHKGKASSFICECGKQAAHWANISRQYKRDLDDFKAMCVECHSAYDANFDAIKEKFS